MSHLHHIQQFRFPYLGNADAHTKFPADIFTLIRMDARNLSVPWEDIFYADVRVLTVALGGEPRLAEIPTKEPLNNQQAQPEAGQELVLVKDSPIPPGPLPTSPQILEAQERPSSHLQRRTLWLECDQLLKGGDNRQSKLSYRGGKLDRRRKAKRRQDLIVETRWICVKHTSGGFNRKDRIIKSGERGEEEAARRERSKSSTTRDEL